MGNPRQWTAAAALVLALSVLAACGGPAGQEKGPPAQADAGAADRSHTDARGTGADLPGAGSGETGAEPGQGEPPEEARPGEAVPFRLLASQKTLPHHREMEEDEIIRLVQDDIAFAETWRLFRLEGPPPAVDWGREVALFFGLGESGSCPLQIESIRLEAERGLLTADLTFADEQVGKADPRTGAIRVCTSDYTPRTFVVAVPQEALPEGMVRARIGDAYGRHGPIHTLRGEGESAAPLQKWDWTVRTEGASPTAGEGPLVQTVQLRAGQDWLTVELHFPGQTEANIAEFRFNGLPVSQAWQSRTEKADDRVTIAFPARLGLEPGATAETPFADGLVERIAVREESDGGLVLIELHLRHKVAPSMWFGDAHGRYVGVRLAPPES